MIERVRVAAAVEDELQHARLLEKLSQAPLFERARAHDGDVDEEHRRGRRRRHLREAEGNRGSVRAMMSGRS